MIYKRCGGDCGGGCSGSCSKNCGGCDDTIVIPPKPSLSLVKTGVFQDENGDGAAQVGETILYTFEVCNTGNVGITNITITDALVTVVGGPIDLAVGACDSTTFTASYALTEADIEAGSVQNSATAGGDGPDGPVTVDDDEDTDIPDEPVVCETEICVQYVISPTDTTQPSPIVFPNGDTDVIPTGGAVAWFAANGFTQTGTTSNGNFIMEGCFADCESIPVFYGAADDSDIFNGFPTPSDTLPFLFTAISDIRGSIISAELCTGQPNAIEACEWTIPDDPEPTTKWCSNTILWASANPNCFFEFGGVQVPDNGSQQNFVADYNAAAADAGSPHSFELTDSSEICYTGTGEFGPDSEICRVDERGEVKGCTTFEEVPA